LGPWPKQIKMWKKVTGTSWMAGQRIPPLLGTVVTRGWVGCMGYKVRRTKRGFAEPVWRMAWVLCCDMNPLVQDHSRNGNCHQPVPLIAVQAVSLGSQHLCEAGAFDVNKVLDLPMIAANPSQRPRDRGRS
jgi:hypothetical protein